MNLFSLALLPSVYPKDDQLQKLQTNAYFSSVYVGFHYTQFAQFDSLVMTVTVRTIHVHAHSTLSTLQLVRMFPSD